MITYVNTVFVSNKEGAAVLTAMPAATTTNAVPANYGDFILMNCDESTKGDATKLYTVDATTNTFKIGMITKNNATIISKADGSVKYHRRSGDRTLPPVRRRYGLPDTSPSFRIPPLQ